MTEKAITFGPTGALVGVLTEPDSQASPEKRPAVILLNAGMLHRVGPFRLNVDLGRRLAALGFPAFRMDLSGLGDSPANRDNRSRKNRTIYEIGQCMDTLTSRLSVSQFVLIGLCTGADNAHAAALADRRVCGAVLIEGYAYRTPRFYLHRYAPFLLNPLRMAHYLRWRLMRLIHKTKQGVAHGEGEEVEAEFSWIAPERSQAAEDIRELVDRGTRLLCIYSGDSRTREAYNYQGQLRDMFPDVDFRGLVEDMFIRDGDHIFSQLAAREQLMERICGWMGTST